MNISTVYPSGRDVPPHCRLAVRQAVPILAGLVCLLSAMLLLGYVYARGQILEAARAQTTQLAGSIAGLAGYSTAWVESSLTSLAGALEECRAQTPPDPTGDHGGLAARIMETLTS